MTHRIIQFAALGTDYEEEFEELKKYFTNEELDRILDGIRLPNGTIDELLEVFMERLREKYKKKKK